VIPHDVEHIPLVADGINGIEVLLDVGKARPSACLDNANPHLKCRQRVGVFLCEPLNSLFREYSHIFYFECKDTNKFRNYKTFL